jgi:hypothetical protein
VGISVLFAQGMNKKGSSFFEEEQKNVMIKY